ncbi:MAG: MFS transporter [Betaproteobacteria bacterium]|nr:MAG: MFS transporter [Betaproteobacteria bacterium]
MPLTFADIVANPRKERQFLWLIAIMNFTNIVDFMVMMPLSAYLMRDFGISSAQFGVLVSAYALSAAASSLMLTSIADRFDRKTALLLSYAGLIIGTIGCAVAPNYSTLLIARAVAGFFGGVQGSITMAMLGDVIPDARRGRAMSLVMLAFSFSAVIGVPLSLYVAGHSTWRAPFIGLSVLCIALWFVAHWALPAMRTHIREGKPTGVWRSYMEVLSNRNHFWAMTMSALLTLSGMIVIPYIAPTRIANEGLTESQLALFYIVGGAMTFFTRPLFGSMSDKYFRPAVYYWLVMFSGIPILLITHPLGGGMPMQIAISVLFFIFVSGRFVPATAMVTAATTPHMRGRLMSLNAAVQNLFLGIAAMLGGAMLTTLPSGRIVGYEAVGCVAVLFGLASIWAGYKVRSVS